MFLGLDLGTSGVRALLVDDAGSAVGSADAPLQVFHPHSGWSEQDPAAWIDAVRNALQCLRADHASAVAAVTGIAVSGHMHGAVLLDNDNAVLRPCILWNDTRSHVQAKALDTDAARALSGNITFPGFTAPKLAWVAAQEPDIFARVTTVMSPKDFLVLWLTGVRVTEMSDASGTGWLNVGARTWADPLLAASGMRDAQMPRLLEGTHPVSTVRSDVAANLGVTADCLVIAGAADNAAAACGVGALEEGDGFVSLGTSGVVMAARAGYAPDAARAVHSFCHAVPERWYQMGVTLACTDSLNWLARVTGTAPADLTAPLGDRATPPGRLQFFPYLSGERTPHNDAEVRGGFAGLDIGHDAADLTRAVLEGVSFALADCLDALRATGVKPASLIAVGGGSNSPYWLDLLAAALNLPLEVPAQGDFGAALGAARIAMCGVTGADPATVMTKPPTARVISPRPDLVDACAVAHERFRRSYAGARALQ